MPAKRLLPLIALVLFSLCLAACGGDDDDDNDDFAEEPASPLTATGGVYTGGGGEGELPDVGDDDTDDDPIPPATPNPDAKADAFKLFYKERSERVITAMNRFGLYGDAVAATAIGKAYTAKDGDEYEVVAGPNDNNPIGISAYTTWKMYQALGGRKLELSLIRMFEGLVFSERVSGHEGITCREALPGWTRVMDGVNGTVTRTRYGVPFDPPVVYSDDLEQEILDTFFDGLTFTYRENPGEYYWNFKPRNELTGYAVTFVFSPSDDILYISNCCSSWMKTPPGRLWEGAYWANHNSRDNFTDYVMGYLAAQEAEATPGLPDDLALAAHNAAEAGRRTGNRIIADGYVQMTVDEHHDYETLVPGGQVRPDGTTEWQDLGSISACPMAYAAHALSTEGLSWPVPEAELNGAIETFAIKWLFDTLGIEADAPNITCRSIDDALIGMTWGDIMDMQLLGMPWYEVAEVVSRFAPTLFFDLFDGMMDDFVELELGVVNLCYYAQFTGDDLLYDEARDSLWNFVRLQTILADLLYGVANDKDSRATLDSVLGEDEVKHTLENAEEMLYKAARYARMFDIDTPLEFFNGFALGEQRTAHIENYLNLGDTAEWPLIDAAEIDRIVEDKLAEKEPKEPWIVERYRARFDTPPFRRDGDGYECIGPDGEWMPTENPRHVWMGSWKLWWEGPLCIFSPKTLDCSWAKLGCVAADLNDSGSVDSADADLFDTAWDSFGDGAACDAGNANCDGADLDQSGTLDSEDGAFMDAAQGCVR